jgi:hypothetical protein
MVQLLLVKTVGCLLNSFCRLMKKILPINRFVLFLCRKKNNSYEKNYF